MIACDDDYPDDEGFGDPDEWDGDPDADFRCSLCLAPLVDAADLCWGCARRLMEGFDGRRT